MRDQVAQTCPLCSADAVYYFVDHEERKFFKCSGCSKFQITVRAEERVGTAPRQWREDLAERVRRTPEEHLLVIRLPSPGEKGESSEGLKADYVPKKELPL